MRVITTEQRNGGLDYLRCILMFLIIIGHIQSESFIDTLTINDSICIWLFEKVIGSAERLSINGFLMISSWFLVDKKLEGKKFIFTWMMVWSINVVITVSMFIFKIVPFSIVYAIQACMPIIGRPQWYMCEYLLLLLSIPLINKLLSLVDVNSIRKFLIFAGFYMVGVSTFVPLDYTQPMFSEYFWFIFVYVLIFYLKREKIVSRIARYGIVLSIASYTLIIILFCLDEFLLYHKGEIFLNIANYYCDHYEALPAFLCSFGLFVSFANLKCKPNNIVSLIARSTGAIYIIHSVPVFWRYDSFKLWENVFHISYWYSKNMLPLAMFVISVLVMLVGTIIYVIYRCLFERIAERSKYVKILINLLDSVVYHNNDNLE